MPGTGYVYPPRTVVNITVDTHPQQTTFQGVPTDTDVYYCENGQTVVAATKEAMNNELTSMMRRSEEIIRSVDEHRVISPSIGPYIQHRTANTATRTPPRQVRTKALVDTPP